MGAAGRVPGGATQCGDRYVSSCPAGRSSLVERLGLLFLTGRAPEGIEVNGSLDLSDTRIRALPPGLHVRGDLILRHCPRLRRIGDGLRVDGRLVIGGGEGGTPESRRVSLKELPPGLVVGGALTLHHAFLLESFPEDATIGGSFTLTACHALVRWPKRLSVGGDLEIRGGQRLEQLPDELNVAGSLRLSGTQIHKLPASLRVGGHLVVARTTPLQHLDGNLSAGGNILIRSRALETFEGSVSLGGNLVLPGCSSLKSLPKNLNVPGRLDLMGCSSLEALPTGLVIGDGGVDPYSIRLSLADCAALKEMPRDLRCADAVDVAGSGLTDWPAELSHLRIAWRGFAVLPDVVFHPDRLGPFDVLLERNAELRRVMIERVGVEALLEKARAREIDRDSDRGGDRRLFHVEGGLGRREPFAFLLCRCPSTKRVYLLSVPPILNSCVQAAAWLAGFENPDDYHPVDET